MSDEAQENLIGLGGVTLSSLIVMVGIWGAFAMFGCEADPPREPLYGPCSATQECAAGTCVASDYGGDEGYCTWSCSTFNPDVLPNMCVFVDSCGAGCCKINHAVGGNAQGYCVPNPGSG